MAESRSSEHSSIRLTVFLLGTALSLIVALLYFAGAFNSLELYSYDLRMTTRGAQPPREDILLVTIDPTTVRDLNRKTTAISRAEHAQVIDKLAHSGASLIVYDMEFSSPSDNEDDDYYLQQVLAENPGKVIMSRYIAQNEWVRPYELFRSATVSVGAWPFDLKADDDGVAKLSWPGADVDGYALFVSAAPITDPYAEDVTQLTSLEPGSTAVELAGLDPGEQYHFLILGHKQSDLLAGEGAINYLEDQDDRIRRMPLVATLPDGEERAPTLSLAAAIAALWPDSTPAPCKVQSRDETCLEGAGITLRIPTVAGSMLINYAGPRGTFESVSFSKLLMEDAKLPEINGRIVLVGNTHPTAHDEYPTPFTRSGDDKDTGEHGYTSGLEIHANALQTILSRNFITKQHDKSAMLVIIALGIAVSLLWMLFRAFSAPGIVVLVLSLAAVVGVSLHLFEAENYWLVTSPLLIVIGLNFVGIMVVQTLGEYREKRFIKGAFGMYLAPAVIEQLIKDPSKLDLGGEEREMTAMFTDVQGFSTISEKLTPHQLVKLLNEYLTLMCNELFEHEGTVDKFEGDAIIAFFGAPIPYSDHAARACLTALHMQRTNRALNEKLKSEGRPELITRFGINTGKMVVGNMGSDQRMDYTIMGDDVNLAARLEGANKQYGSCLMISETTYEQARDAVEVRELDLIRVVGKQQPVRVYELLSEKGELDEATVRKVEYFAQGLELYRGRNWEDAIERFREAISVSGEDKPSEAFISRCELFMEDPPGPDWDGVFGLKSK